MWHLECLKLHNTCHLLFCDSRWGAINSLSLVQNIGILDNWYYTDGTINFNQSVNRGDKTFVLPKCAMYPWSYSHCLWKSILLQNVFRSLFVEICEKQGKCVSVARSYHNSFTIFPADLPVNLHHNSFVSVSSLQSMIPGIFSVTVVIDRMWTPLIRPFVMMVGRPLSLRPAVRVSNVLWKWCVVAYAIMLGREVDSLHHMHPPSFGDIPI